MKYIGNIINIINIINIGDYVNIIETIIIGISLAMDAFAVSISKGILFGKFDYKKAIIVSLYFGVFQAIMPLGGYLLGNIFNGFIEIIHYWIAFTILFIVGIIAAATMVIPGVSGSLVLMILGYYYPVINTINALFKEDFISNAFVLGIFGLGIIIGIVAISKLLEILFKKYKVKTYFGVLGFVFASIIAIPLSACIELNSISTSLIQIIVSIVLLIFGTLISFNLGEK